MPSLWFSLCTIFSWLQVSGIVWVFQTYINQCEMTIFFFLRKLRWKCRQKTNKKKNQRQKNPQQLQNSINTTWQSTTKIQVHYTMTVKDHGGTTGTRRWGTSRKRSVVELASRGNWQKTGKQNKRTLNETDGEWPHSAEEMWDAEGKLILQT